MDVQLKWLSTPPADTSFFVVRFKSSQRHSFISICVIFRFAFFLIAMDFHFNSFSCILILLSTLSPFFGERNRILALHFIKLFLMHMWKSAWNAFTKIKI